MGLELFSTYSTAENRVTAAVLAVLQSLSLSRIERLLGALLGDSEFTLATFQNQISKGGKGVPDGLILTSCRILIETKIKRGTVARDQLERHLARLDNETERSRTLLVLTPDDERPTLIDEMSSDFIAWSSFAGLDQAIDELLADISEVVSEREAFLLRELQGLMRREELVTPEQDVVVVAARTAWPEYQRHSAYVCQPGRTFQRVQRIAFYCDGEIKPIIPKVLNVFDHITFGDHIAEPKLAALVRAMIDDRASNKQVSMDYKVFLLSPPDDSETLVLPDSIRNDIQSASGRISAYTQGQRYTSEGNLKHARTTMDLV